MSDFDTLERSTQGSRPIELYEFVTPTITYRYASTESEFVNLGQTYEPIAISHDPISYSLDERTKIVKVTMPAETEFAKRYISVNPSGQVMGKIIRLQLDETPTPIRQVMFIGFVRGVQFDTDFNLAKIGLLSADGAKSESLPRRTYSSLCSNQIYDKFCGANSAAHTFIGPCTAMENAPSGNKITITGSEASDHKFAGGFAAIVGEDSELRMVISQIATTDDVLLLQPFPVSPVGRQIKLVAGCDKKLTGDCSNVFDRVKSFNGAQYVPGRPLFELGLE